MATLLLPSGAFLVKRREVLQKTRAEQFGLGRVPPTIKSGVGSTEKRSPHADMRSGGTIRRSTTAPALTRRLLPTTKGYCSPIGCRACPNTPYVASCRGSGRGLVWHVDSAAPPVDRGDSWSATGPSEDTPRSGRAEDVGSTWLRCGCYVARHVALDHYWPHHSPPHPPTPTGIIFVVTLWGAPARVVLGFGSQRKGLPRSFWSSGVCCKEVIRLVRRGLVAPSRGCVSFSTESTMAEGCALGTIDLKTIEKRVSSATELKMAERHVSGTTGLMLAERHVSGTTGLMMAEGHVSGTIGLM
ncbi:hypothetical protein BHE74_00008547 [Ensete ventricosum]|nr:hypothetical protein BHE74_00008547 [Ensete ventricosum]